MRKITDILHSTNPFVESFIMAILTFAGVLAVFGFILFMVTPGNEIIKAVIVSIVGFLLLWFVWYQALK